MGVSLDMEKLIEKFYETWTKNFQCPVCNKNDWIIQPELFEIRKVPKKSAQRPKSYDYTPLVQVICKYCSYTMLFNANLMEDERQPHNGDAQPEEGNNG